MKPWGVIVLICIAMAGLESKGDETDRFKGGAYDGAGSGDMDSYASLTPAPRGTVIRIGCIDAEGSRRKDAGLCAGSGGGGNGKADETKKS